MKSKEKANCREQRVALTTQVALQQGDNELDHHNDRSNDGNSLDVLLELLNGMAFETRLRAGLLVANAAFGAETFQVVNAGVFTVAAAAVAPISQQIVLPSNQQA